MAADLHIRGQWPHPISIARNWSKAYARPWNDDVPGPLLRLERGGAAFLRDASDELVAMSRSDVLSPALIGGATHVWERSGYQPGFELILMEGEVDRRPRAVDPRVTVAESPDWAALGMIDAASFDDFWRMGVPGLREASGATPVTVVLVAGDPHPVGYAIVGIRWSTAYLQRIAVRPESSGQGLGSALVRAAQSWARAKGANTITLNVRPGNTRAIALYEREGLARTGASVKVLRYAS